MTGQSQVSKVSWLRGAFALVALGAVLFFGTDIGSFVQNTFANFFAPHAATDSAYVGLSKDELVRRLDKTEEALRRVKYQTILYGLLSEENQHLKNASALQSFPRAVVARVIARPPRTHYDTLVLDQGSASGIRKNNLVVYQGIALGKIISVHASTATVELFSTPGAENDAILGDPQGIVVLKGVGGGAFELSLPQNVIVQPGDVVRIPSSETLAVGIVVSAVDEATAAAQTVYIRSPVSMNDLDFVRVIPE